MAKPEKFTAEEMAQALTEAKGFISVVAKRLGCNQSTVRNYIARYACCREAVENSREAMKDFAESKLFKLVDEENITAIIFYLKTQGRDRGYIERQEVTGKDGEDIVFVIKERPHDTAHD